MGYVLTSRCFLSSFHFAFLRQKRTRATPCSILSADAGRPTSLHVYWGSALSASIRVRWRRPLPRQSSLTWECRAFYPKHGIFLSHQRAAGIPVGEFWKWAYHPDVLAELCRFRTAFIEDCSSSARIALRGIILGALHGPRQKTFQSYFSNQSPRTYAPKPSYATRYWQKRNCRPAKVDVLDIVERRANRYYGSLPDGKGEVRLGDSRDARYLAPDNDGPAFLLGDNLAAVLRYAHLYPGSVAAPLVSRRTRPGGLHQRMSAASFQPRRIRAGFANGMEQRRGGLGAGRNDGRPLRRNYRPPDRPPGVGEGIVSKQRVAAHDDQTRPVRPARERDRRTPSCATERIRSSNSISGAKLA